MLFFALRVVLFGVVVVRTWYYRMRAPDGFPMHMYAAEIDLVAILWLAGWLLQLHWLSAIIKKLRRKFFAETKPKPMCPVKAD